jgi:ribosome maturation protein SDO1
MRVNQPVGIVEMTNIAIIKYRTSTNQKFEIACYKNKAINWRNGVEKDLRY